MIWPVSAIGCISGLECWNVLGDKGKSSSDINMKKFYEVDSYPVIFSFIEVFVIVVKYLKWNTCWLIYVYTLWKNY